MGAYKFGQKWGIGRWTRGLMTLVRSCVARKKIGCSLCGISAANKNRGVTLVNSNGSSSKTSNFSNGLTVHSHTTADGGPPRKGRVAKAKGGRGEGAGFCGSDV